MHASFIYTKWHDISTSIVFWRIWPQGVSLALPRNLLHAFNTEGFFACDKEDDFVATSFNKWGPERPRTGASEDRWVVAPRSEYTEAFLVASISFL
jgi:hypothetical protein